MQCVNFLYVCVCVCVETWRVCMCACVGCVVCARVCCYVSNELEIFQTKRSLTWTYNTSTLDASCPPRVRMIYTRVVVCSHANVFIIPKNLWMLSVTALKTRFFCWPKQQTYHKVHSNFYNKKGSLSFGLKKKGPKRVIVTAELVLDHKIFPKRENFFWCKNLNGHCCNSIN